jgi:TonB family protein
MFSCSAPVGRVQVARLALGLLGACGSTAPPPPLVVDVAAAAPPPSPKTDAAQPELPPAPEPPPEPPPVAPHTFEASEVVERVPEEEFVAGVGAPAARRLPPPGSVSREAQPRLAGPLSCAFPPSAKEEEARVPLEVFVDAFGAVTRVGVLKHSEANIFAATAIDCMTRSRFIPGRGPDGSPIASHVVVVVRFARR